MSEERIAEFRERAAAAVELPDLNTLSRRGAALHRRRVAAATLSAMAAAGVIGFAAFNLPGADSSGPVIVRPDEQTSGPVRFANALDLQPGVPAYDEFPLSTGGTVRIQLTAPAEGWFVYLGEPERGINIGPEEDFTGLLWHETTGIDQRPCVDTPPTAKQVVPMKDSLRPLVDLDLTTVVSRPRADRLGNRDAQHAALVLRECNSQSTAPLATASGVSGTMPIGATFDVWLVPLPEADTAVVIWDPTGDGSPEVRRQWQQILDSMVITVEPASGG